jgi:NAD-dependent SIR2 family protein deacetylase
MCATCGCLKSSAPAPEEGTYQCVECKDAGKPEKVTVKKGETMPACKACGGSQVHWVKA